MPTIEYERNGEIESIEREDYTFAESGVVSAWNKGVDGPEDLIKFPLDRIVVIHDIKRGGTSAR